MVNTLKLWWSRLGSHACGRWLFSKILGLLIPYTGSIKAQVAKISPGLATVYLTDKRPLRNHLHSVHAIALANLAELSTGLALHFALAERDRAILTKLEIEYLKKARGKIKAEAALEDHTQVLLGPIPVRAQLSDESGILVCSILATWLVRRDAASL